MSYEETHTHTPVHKIAVEYVGGFVIGPSRLFEAHAQIIDAAMQVADNDAAHVIWDHVDVGFSGEQRRGGQHCAVDQVHQIRVSRGKHPTANAGGSICYIAAQLLDFGHICHVYWGFFGDAVVEEKRDL